MRRTWIRAVTLPVLAAALSIVACSEQRGPAPLLGPGDAPLGQSAGQQPQYRLVAARAITGNSHEVSARIGIDGGTLELNGHRLTVPAGAVLEPTTFSMRVRNTGHVRVDLRASVADARGRPVDVGARGFRVPVLLALSAAHVAETVPTGELRIVWVLPNGRLEPVRTSWSDAASGLVQGELHHFSDYAIGMPGFVGRDVGF